MKSVERECMKTVCIDLSNNKQFRCVTAAAVAAVVASSSLNADVTIVRWFVLHT